MSHRAQFSEIKMKLLGCVAVLACGMAASAFADNSLPALPALPALPSIPQPGNSQPSQTPVNTSPAVTANSTPTSGVTIPLPSATPVTLKTPANTLPPLPGTEGSKTPPLTPLAQLPAPQPEATEATTAPTPATTPVASSALPALPGIPALPVPGATTTVPTSTALPTLPVPGATTDVAATLPEVKVDTLGKEEKTEKEEKKVKSWETKLAATPIAPLPNFRYKRELLPELIYRTSYNRDNDHLPRRVTRDDYAKLLLSSVARNDVEATRALLNAGTAVNVTTPDGETALALAQRVGATEVAQLLTARGAR